MVEAVGINSCQKYCHTVLAKRELADTVEHGYKDMLGILKICPYIRVVLISVVFQKSPSLTFSALYLVYNSLMCSIR